MYKTIEKKRKCQSRGERTNFFQVGINEFFGFARGRSRKKLWAKICKTKVIAKL